MERGVRLRLNKTLPALFFASLLLMGCARNAPELPNEYSSTGVHLSASYEKLPDRVKAADCSMLAQELIALDNSDQEHEDRIHSNREKNQVAGYVGAVLFPPVFLAIDNDDVAKDNLTRNQEKRDQIFIAQKMKNCS